MISKKDCQILRKLAAEYAEYVESDEMNRKREIWRLTNRLEERTVPFLIEDNGSYVIDLQDEKDLCEGEFAREAELYLRRCIGNLKNIDDDRIYPPYYPLQWDIDRPEICPELQITKVADATGRMLGYETNKPLADLKSGLSKLERREFFVDRDLTARRMQAFSDAFGDILPVKLVNEHVTKVGNGMAQKAVKLMGMDNFYIAMLDDPENIHRFFEFVAIESEDFMNWMIEEDLFCLNNGEFWCGSGSIAYTDELPRRKIDADSKYLPEDCWCFIEAQEAVGVSNEMFAEFIFPYMERVANRFGLVYYGCCEPVHALWKTVNKITNLRKITVSPWCELEIVANAAGRGVVLSRKPHPMKLCGETFDPGAMRDHLKEFLDISKDNFVELIFRDNCRINGSMKDRVGQTCRIVKELIGR